jgi:hypothetical protein
LAYFRDNVFFVSGHGQETRPLLLINIILFTYSSDGLSSHRRYAITALSDMAGIEREHMVTSTQVGDGVGLHPDIKKGFGFLEPRFAIKFKKHGVQEGFGPWFSSLRYFFTFHERWVYYQVTFFSLIAHGVTFALRPIFV